MAVGLLTYPLLCPIMDARNDWVRRRSLIGDGPSRRRHIIEHVATGRSSCGPTASCGDWPAAMALSNLGLQLCTWQLVWDPRQVPAAPRLPAGPNQYPGGGVGDHHAYRYISPAVGVGRANT
jgi:hypothetical protein